MDFPNTEAEIMELSQKMLNGYFWHAGDFPHVKRMNLNTKAGLYSGWRRRALAAKSNLRIQTKIARRKLNELIRVMKNCLQKSEVDTIDNPEKLKEIGWGPKDWPKHSQIPGQPVNLSFIKKENSSLILQWQRPQDNQTIKNYIIERRHFTLHSNSAKDGQSNEGFSKWSILKICYETSIILKNQPTGIQLEYRIKSANIAGISMPSNTVLVVLP